MNTQINKPLLTVAVRQEPDLVLARQRARQIAVLLGFDQQDQTRIATAVSEIARNAYRYAGGGKVEFALESEGASQRLVIRVSDSGPGIQDLAHVLSGNYHSETGMGLGLIGAHKLMDHVDIRTARGKGTEVLLRKALPTRLPPITAPAFAQISAELATVRPTSALTELQQQNQELMRTLGELRQRQDDLLRLNRELKDTNRGVVALYAELDEKAEHLRRADEMKSRFLSNMSHELRTPLNSIHALSTLLLERTDGELTAEQERQVRFIVQAANDLRALVNDLLDLAKIEAGKVDVRTSEFSVADLFSALRGMLRPLMPSEDVKLIFEEPDASLVLHTDEGKVSQILRNLISNAIKFTERGEVRVRATLTADGRQVQLSVKDTGIGISEADQSRIFEEFTQVAHSLQGRMKGTGLGLPLCRRLATLLGGEIQLVSTPGVGSTFTAMLPVYFAEPDRSLATVPQTFTLDAERIPVLLVDSDPAMIRLYTKHLQSTRYQAIGVGSIGEARQFMQHARPRVILIDLFQHDEEGWHWLAELKRNPVTSSIGVLVATAAKDEQRAFALGTDAYCRKPLEREVLLEMLDGLIGRLVLVIDDDPAARYLLQKLLAGSGACVIEASNGESGLLTARRMRPSLIFLDLRLPDLSGEEILQRLRSDPELGNVPVAIITSQALTAADHMRLGVGAQAVLQKSELDADRARGILASSGL